MGVRHVWFLFLRTVWFSTTRGHRSPSFASRACTVVALLGSCDSSWVMLEINDKGAAGFIPHLTVLYLDHEQASTVLQFAFSFGRKVRAAPTNTKRKHSEEKQLPSSVVSKQDFAYFVVCVEIKHNNWTPGIVEQDSLRFSVTAPPLEPNAFVVTCTEENTSPDS